MVRDMEMVRKLLLAAERNQGAVVFREPVEAYHVQILIDAGLVEGSTVKGQNADRQAVIKVGAINRLTWQGHEFLDAARDESVWKSTVNKVIKPGVGWTFGLFLEILKEEAKRKLLGG